MLDDLTVTCNECGNIIGRIPSYSISLSLKMLKEHYEKDHNAKGKKVTFELNTVNIPCDLCDGIIGGVSPNTPNIKEAAIQVLKEHNRECHDMTDNLPAIPADMNVLRGQRIGWERKEEYLGKLAEYSADGYLTHEEWEARVKWVQDAHTQEDIDKAFRDLKWAQLQKKTPPEEIGTSRSTPYPGIGFTIFDLAMLVFTISQHDLIGTAIFSIIFLAQLFTTITLWRHQ